MCDVYRNDVTCDFVELAICMVNVLNSFFRPSVIKQYNLKNTF